MSSAIRLSAVLVAMFFFNVGCKNDASADEKKPEKPQIASTVADDALTSVKDLADEDNAKEEKVADKKTAIKEIELKNASPSDETKTDEAKTVSPDMDKVEKAAADAKTTAEPKPELTAIEGLALAELTVARGIEAKKPLDPRTEYKLGEFDKITAFMSVLNPSETEDEIQVSFLNLETGKERGKVTVSIGAQKKWRTWAFCKSINKAGKWEIVVRDKNEQVLGRAPFEIFAAE